MNHSEKRKAALTSERLKQLLHYNPDTGVFTWIKSRGRCKVDGGIAGGLDRYGYCRIKIDGKTYQRSRLAWMYTTGSFPPKFLDHISGVRSDDRIENLRACSAGENTQNLGLTKANKSGIMGVSWKTSHSRWCAQIKHLGVVHYPGLFDKIEDAAEARKAAKAAMHTFNPVDAHRMGVPA